MSESLIHRLENPTYIIPNAHLDVPQTTKDMRRAAEVIKLLMKSNQNFITQDWLDEFARR